MNAPDEPTPAEIAATIADARENGDSVLTGDDIDAAQIYHDERDKAEHRATTRSSFYRPPSNQSQADSDREDRAWHARR